MWAEIEIILTWLTNVGVNNGTSWDIIALSNHILSIFTEKSHMMVLKLHLYRQQLWSGIQAYHGPTSVGPWYQADSGILPFGHRWKWFLVDRSHLFPIQGKRHAWPSSHGVELTFANTITVHHNLKFTIDTILHCWIDLLVVVFCRSCDRIDAKASSPCPWCQQWIPIVVLVQRLLPKIIYYQAADCNGKQRYLELAWDGIHWTDNGSNWRTRYFTSSWVSDVSTKYNYWLIHDWWAHFRRNWNILTSTFCIDLKRVIRGHQEVKCYLPSRASWAW